MNEVIKLKINKETVTVEKSKEILNAFLEACINLDPSIFEPYMEEEDVFQCLDKWLFMDAFKKVLSGAKPHAIDGEVLEIREGTCKGCQRGKLAYEFYNSKGKYCFAYIIKEENEQVEDIFQCNMNSGSLADLFSIPLDELVSDSDFFKSLQEKRLKKKKAKLNKESN